MTVSNLTDHELSAFVLRLTLSPARVFDVPGSAMQGIILKLIAAGDPGLATRLREHAAARPYTVALLREGCTASQLLLRVTAIGGEIHSAIASVLSAYPRAQDGERLTLGPCAVSGVELVSPPEAGPWAGASSLVGVYQSAVQIGDEFVVLLASPLLPRRRPVAWRDGPPRGASLSTSLLFGAMQERWRAFGTALLAPPYEAVMAAATQVHILDSHLSISTHLRRAGAAPIREETRGFVGRLRLRLGGSSSDRHLLRALAAMSFFLGAGVGTASGMGLIRVAPKANKTL